ncbi:hypothetical protein ALC62_11573 [Cyphomyrmex costatus]|uniref:Uncharacterized protein n=1 Tax=Cyphomyrmex costatus TaxID=456900 RepID=A0A151ICD1_9HYME|nr:hypothetical protein ALC62_11573 [Cyphomyrmex costatus]
MSSLFLRRYGKVFQKQIIQFQGNCHFDDNTCPLKLNDLFLKHFLKCFKIFQMIKIILYAGCTVLTFNYFTVHKRKALRMDNPAVVRFLVIQLCSKY